MFDIDSFIEDAKAGKIGDQNVLGDYINSFEHVIIWGAGNLGKSICKKLLDMDIRISVFWDIQFETITDVNGIKVVQPFSSKYDKGKTLVVFCIGNSTLSAALFPKLSENNWNFILKGIDIFYAIICPVSIGADLNTQACISTDICNPCWCNRLGNVLKSKSSTGRLHMDSVAFFVTTACSLRCKYCIAYMNSYKPNQKRIVQFERIKKDIQFVMEAISSAAIVDITGGEPFLHPDISNIVDLLYEKVNYGALLIHSNAVVDIKEEQLKGLDRPKIKAYFSNYTGSLKPEQQKRYDSNIELIKQHGVNMLVEKILPNWAIPPVLEKKEISHEQVIDKKSKCTSKNKQLVVFDGKVFLCMCSLSVCNIIEDYSSDYVLIDSVSSPNELAEEIVKLYNKPMINSCNYCSFSDDTAYGTTDRAGEQGFDERYRL